MLYVPFMRTRFYINGSLLYDLLITIFTLLLLLSAIINQQILFGPKGYLPTSIRLSGMGQWQYRLFSCWHPNRFAWIRGGWQRDYWLQLGWHGARGVAH
jgi:hypothetical protein